MRISGRRRPGGRPDDVMSDLSAARTATRLAQCRESRYPPRRSRAAKRALCGVREELMSSRVRQGEPPGRSRPRQPRQTAKLNAMPTANERLNFRLPFLSFVYFGKRPESSRERCRYAEPPIKHNFSFLPNCKAPEKH